MLVLTYVNKYFNKPTLGSASGRTFFSIFSVFFIFVFLGLDSQNFADAYFDGRLIVTIIVISYFFLMLQAADSRLRRLMLVMVPLSYIGEIIFCNVLDMYDYRENRIPLYVPFGHAIVYGSGYMFSFTKWANQHDAMMKKTFAVFFGAIFIGAGLLFFDILSLILGYLFFRALRRKKWLTLYYYVAIYVLIVEFTGTYFSVWVWDAYAIGFIPTVNPPVGAVFLYIGGDAVLLRVMRYMQKRKILIPTTHQRADEVW
ncbi:MAG: hypothetical protein HRU29_06380 [Rhizobiales bacterium]|nr:hypothetical protein [Hyphomicrobiales bacterium]NRB14012.1 hypothetical protein [Hyphomicrobiales bacterium]